MPDERLIVSTDIATLLAAADAKAARAALGSLAARVLGAADLDTGGSLYLDEVGNYAIAADIGEDWDGTLRIAANREGVWFFDNRTRVEASIYIGGVDSARKVPGLAVVMFVNVTSDAGYSTAVVLPTGGLDTGKTLALAEDFVATNHNELAGLQGGSETERYHITSDEQALIGTALQPTNLPWSIANGGTGAATAALARSALGVTSTGDPIVTAADAPTAFSNLGTLATASPNDTVNSFTLGIPASGFGSTNVAINIQPKGTGAFYLGPVADGTITGGNPRGSMAVDLQLGRGAKQYIASGYNSFAAGYNNTASGYSSTCAGGLTNHASANYSTCVGGAYNKASAEYSIALGYGASATRRGEIAMTAATFTAVTTPTCKSCFLTLSGRTGNDFPVSMALNGMEDYLWLSADRVFSGLANISAVNADGSVTAHFVRQFSVSNVQRTVASVDLDAETVTFTGPHGFVNSDPITIRGDTLPTGLANNVVYYASVVDPTTIKFYSDAALTTQVLLGASAGSGTRLVSRTKLAYAAVMLGADNANGTSVAIEAVTVGSATLADYLAINVTGLAATATPLTGCTASATTDFITKSGHGLVVGDRVVMASLTGGEGLSLGTVYRVSVVDGDTFQLTLPQNYMPTVNIKTDYSDLTIVPANVMRWTAHVSAVETAYGT